MKLVVFIVGFFMATQAQASFLYKDLEFLGMENFSVDKKNDHIYVGFDYVINNPNWYAVIIKPSTLKLTVADVDCGWVKVEEKVKIERKKEGKYPFVLVGDGSKFVKSGFASILYLITGRGVGFNLKGKLDAGVTIFKKKWDLDYTYTMTFEEFLSLF